MRKCLTQDNSVSKRAQLSPDYFYTLLSFCLTIIYCTHAWASTGELTKEPLMGRQQCSCFGQRKKRVCKMIKRSDLCSSSEPITEQRSRPKTPFKAVLRSFTILHTQQHRTTSNNDKLNSVLCVAFPNETVVDPGESQVSSGDNVELNCETPSLTQQFNRHLNQRSLLDLKR